MNVSTISISRDEALRKLEMYQSINARKRTAEDERLRSLYAAISNGARVINLVNAISETGLNELWQPKLAIARADWTTVYCHRLFERDGYSLGFTSSARWNDQATARNIRLPERLFDFPARGTWWTLKSAVPYVPPDVRPKHSLQRYHILF